MAILEVRNQLTNVSVNRSILGAVRSDTRALRAVLGRVVPLVEEDLQNQSHGGNAALARLGRDLNRYFGVAEDHTSPTAIVSRFDFGQVQLAISTSPDTCVFSLSDDDGGLGIRDVSPRPGENFGPTVVLSCLAKIGQEPDEVIRIYLANGNQKPDR